MDKWYVSEHEDNSDVVVRADKDEGVYDNIVANCEVDSNTATASEILDNAYLIAAAPDLLTVSHNLANTMGIDYAIKKLSTMFDDNMAVGAAVILRGIQRQAKEAIAKAKPQAKHP